MITAENFASVVTSGSILLGILIGGLIIFIYDMKHKDD